MVAFFLLELGICFPLFFSSLLLLFSSSSSFHTSSCLPHLRPTSAPTARPYTDGAPLLSSSPKINSTFNSKIPLLFNTKHPSLPQLPAYKILPPSPIDLHHQSHNSIAISKPLTKTNPIFLFTPKSSNQAGLAQLLLSAPPQQARRRQICSRSGHLLPRRHSAVSSLSRCRPPPPLLLPQRHLGPPLGRMHSSPPPASLQQISSQAAAELLPRRSLRPPPADRPPCRAPGSSCLTSPPSTRRPFSTAICRCLPSRTNAAALHAAGTSDPLLHLHQRRSGAPPSFPPAPLLHLCSSSFTASIRAAGQAVCSSPSSAARLAHSSPPSQQIQASPSPPIFTTAALPQQATARGSSPAQ